MPPCRAEAAHLALLLRRGTDEWEALTGWHLLRPVNSCRDTMKRGRGMMPEEAQMNNRRQYRAKSNEIAVAEDA